jgi:hypothetical protein
MKYWVDPPSGWRYGFPKIWDSEEYPNIVGWLLKSGYPAKDIEFTCGYLRMWNHEDAR